MGNQYSYPESKENQTKLEEQVKSLGTQVQTLNGVINNFMSVEGFGGETQKQIKAFMGEVVLGATEASQLLIENVDTEYKILQKRFQGIDGAENTIIYDSRLNAAIMQNDEYATKLMTHANEINGLIREATNFGVRGRLCNTAEITAHQNATNTKIQQLRDKLTAEGKNKAEADGLDTFIDSVRQFISYLGNCQPSSYISGTLAAQPFYKGYSERAIAILYGKSDGYYTSKKIQNLSSLEKAAYIGKITTYLMDPENTVQDEEGNIHSPKFNALLVSATDDKTVLDLAALMTLMSAQARINYLENPDSEQGKQLAKQAKVFAGIAGILSLTANSMTTAQESTQSITMLDEPYEIGSVENPFDISYKDEGAKCNFKFTFNVLKPENTIVIDNSGYKTSNSKETATMSYSLDSGIGSTDSLNKLADSIKLTDMSVMTEMLTHIGIDKFTAAGLSQLGKFIGNEVPLLGEVVSVANSSKELKDNLKEVKILNGKAHAIKISDAMSKFKMAGGQIQVEDEFYMSVSPTEKTVTMMNRYNQITGEHITFDDLVDENKLDNITKHINNMSAKKPYNEDIYQALLNNDSEIDYRKEK